MLDVDEKFLLRYRGEIREALIMIEGDDGAFTLLAHGPLPSGRLWALVQSCASERSFVLVRAKAPNSAVARWREANASGSDLGEPVTAAEAAPVPAVAL